MTAALEPVLKRIDEDFDNYVASLCELLRIKSIGTDPAYDEETRRAAVWCADQFTEMGGDFFRCGSARRIGWCVPAGQHD